MTKLVVFSNARAGMDDEYNEWYDNVHLKDILDIPGVTAAERYNFAPLGEGDSSEHRYLAVYELEGDPAAVMAEFGARSADGRMLVSPALDTDSVLMKVWEPRRA